MTRTSARRRAAALLAAFVLVSGGVSIGLASPANAGGLACCTK
jgi:hypothetical protein